MKLIKEFIIKDLLDYELNNEVNILEELSSMNTSIIIDMIQLGNKCSDAEAFEIFNIAKKEMNKEEIVNELVLEMFGETEKDENEIDSNDIKSISDILEQFYSEIQVVDNNLSLSEFRGMSTRYLYRYADGLQKRYIVNKNKQYRDNYENVAMFMSALSGKLKECPQFNEDGTLHQKSLIEKLGALRGNK